MRILSFQHRPGWLSRRYIIRILIFAVFLFYISSCKKGWLDVNPLNNAIALNTSTNTLQDYQTLMGNSFLYSSNALGVVGADDYYLSQTTLTSFPLSSVTYYLWAPNGYASIIEPGWTTNYKGIYACNIAIDGLNKLESHGGNLGLWNQVYGSALFFRAWSYYQLSQIYMKQYDSTSAGSDMGVPLRLNPDVTQNVPRGTVQQVYNQIIGDLNQARSLLPGAAQQYKVQPTKQAAYAVLAQTYLVLGDYVDARSSADSALSYGNVLLDYNSYVSSVTPTSTYGFPSANLNPEVFLLCAATNPTVQRSAPAKIDSTLYKSYDSNDLRKIMCFIVTAKGIAYRGNYDVLGTNDFYTAPAVDELYLIKAECEARLGDVSGAMRDLNTLLKNRYRTGTFANLSATDPDNALRIILTERRKELVMRGTRWTDLRRLGKDPRFATTITRIYNGQNYTLTPNSNLSVWPIPNDEIIYSDNLQNPR